MWFLFFRFSQLRHFSLYHWTKNASYAVEVSHQDQISVIFNYCFIGS